jgi:hypothetical protein
MKTALDQLRNLFQSKGFATRTFVENKQWALEVLRNNKVVDILFFDYKTESLISIG